MTSMPTAIGTTTAKIQRHEPSWSSTPDTAGPRAGATAIARVTLPMTLPRSRGATMVISVVISSGIITAVPLAWTIRAPSSTGKLHAAVARTVPVMNSPSATVKARRVVTRWRNQPVMGMTTARVSMNAVDSHCAARAVMSKSCMSRGIALTMIVSLRMTTNVAPTRTRRMPVASGCVDVAVRWSGEGVTSGPSIVRLGLMR